MKVGKAVSEMWKRLQQSGLIYLGKYEGWYCVSDEMFLTEDQVSRTETNFYEITETKVVDVVDPKTGQKHKASAESGHKVEWVIEDNYKFKLSEFQKPLLEWLDKNPSTTSF